MSVNIQTIHDISSDDKIITVESVASKTAEGEVTTASCPVGFNLIGNAH